MTISTNGIRPLPTVGFAHVAVAISLFGGGPLDDALRGYRVNGSSFSGLFETALGHYRNDPRVIFVYALSEEGLQYVEPTVRAIQDNGNQVTFNFYSAHGSDQALRIENEQRTLAEALRVKQAYPETVVCHPYFIEALITGRRPTGTASSATTSAPASAWTTRTTPSGYATATRSWTASRSTAPTTRRSSSAAPPATARTAGTARASTAGCWSA